MCGGCGTRTDVDWATPFLGTRVARSAAAAVVASAVPRGVDVRAAPAGWWVRRPTGAHLLLGTLTALAAALEPRPDAAPAIPVAPESSVPPLDRRTPVTVVHGDVPGAVSAEEPDWPERVMAGGGSPVVAAGRRPVQVLHELLQDPLRRHVRVTGLQSATLPGWQTPAGRLPDVPLAVPAVGLPGLAALLAIRLRARPAGDRTRTAVTVGPVSLVLDALGPTALCASVVAPAAVRR